MHRKLTWLAFTLALALIATPAALPQNTWVVSDDGDTSSYTLFGSDDSAFLGVTTEEETEHDEGGARITSVVDGSAADDAGLKEGDIVVGFAGEKIRGPVGLTKKIRKREPGDAVQITVLRDGKRRTLDLELGERSKQWGALAPHVLERLENLEIPDFEFDMENLGERLEGLKGIRGLAPFAEDCEGDDCSFNFEFFTGRPRLGVQLTETTVELREHLGGSKNAGVLVSKVIEDSAAEDAGIQVGDLIVEVGRTEVSDSNDLRRELAERVGETFDIEVIRDGRPVSLSVTLEEEDEDRPSGPRARFAVPVPVAPVLAVPHAAPAPPVAFPVLALEDDVI